MGARTDELAAASRKLVYEVVLSEDSGNFKFNAVELPDEAKAKIDAMISQLMADPKGSFFEIEGHTDSTGPASYNQGLSARRAASVKSYLVGKGLPASAIEASGLGETAPVADNATAAGRAQNRRVEVEVQGTVK